MSYRRFEFSYKETITTVLAEDRDLYMVAVDAMMEARREIESYIERDPFFLATLTPYHCEGGIIGEMSRASLLAGVGPMASVAGAIAGYALDRMVEHGASFGVVDNGGDIALLIDKPLVVGVYAGREEGIALRIEPEDGIGGVCTSSGRIGHSFSFGDADAATVFCSDPCIADALATALGNEIVEGRAIEEVLEKFWEDNKNHITACLVIREGMVAMAGEVPEIVPATIDMDLIAGHPRRSTLITKNG
jgi:hypothetical protein